MRTIRRHLPTGRTLPAAEWERRHQAIVIVLLALALGLPVYGLLVGHAWLHGVTAGVLLLVTALLARQQRARRLWASSLASTGLCTACAVAVHLSGGLIEAHFMFFVVIIIVSLYEDWRPFLIAFGFVVLHHGIMGVLDPHSVYDHPGNPWGLALVHGGFVLAASIAAVVSWRLNEDLRAASLRAAEQARASDDRFRSAFEDGPVCMAIIGARGPARGTLIRVNRTLCLSVGHTEGGLVGADCSVLFDPATQARVLEAIDDLLAGRKRVHHDELVLRDHAGETFEARLSMSLVAGEAGLRDVIVQIEDVSERNRLERELHDLAEIDPLTGVFNRRRFELELERGRRTRRCGAVILVDLDGFKAVNDTVGHQAGDEMLIAAARALGDRTRSTDIVARLGGDEFAVLIHDVSPDIAAAMGAAVVERIGRWAVSGEGADARHTTASVGVVAYAADTELSDDQLLNDADLAMYEAKECGGNRCVVYSAEQDAVEGRISWPDRIRRALDDDRLVLYAQPILDTRSNKILRYELLVRMLGADGVLIPPGAFLPVAERRGMISMIDRWVVREAIALLGQRVADVRLQINVSARSLSDPDFLGFIRGEFAASGASPANLVFEVTETAAIANFDDARSFLTSLSAMGCGIALDDFGAGFASFHYIKNLPFDELKIDGQFIQCLTTNADDLVLVETLVRLARGLGKRTVAEYVEDAATLRLVSAVGVDYAQGYFIGAPEPALPLIAGIAWTAAG
jgi:diguanylate cyclase (GGDEF)-like protein/PAS domain S-box-containing protein